MAYIMWFSLVCTALFIQVIRGCPNGWETFDGSCYFVSDLREDWSTALNTCVMYHAHLVDVVDAHEDNFLEGIITKYHYEVPVQSRAYNFWLGGTDMLVEGDWRWTGDDQRMNYTNWYPGEPNNMHSHGEDCLVAHISGSTHFNWRDRKCTSKYHFVCEIRGRWITFG